MSTDQHVCQSFLQEHDAQRGTKNKRKWSSWSTFSDDFQTLSPATESHVSSTFPNQHAFPKNHTDRRVSLFFQIDIYLNQILRIPPNDFMKSLFLICVRTYEQNWNICQRREDWKMKVDLEQKSSTSGTSRYSSIDSEHWFILCLIPQNGSSAGGENRWADIDCQWKLWAKKRCYQICWCLITYSILE